MDRGNGPMAAGPARAGPPNMLLAADKQTLLSWVLSAACVYAAPLRTAVPTPRGNFVDEPSWNGSRH